MLFSQINGVINTQIEWLHTDAVIVQYLKSSNKETSKYAVVMLFDI